MPSLIIAQATSDNVPGGAILTFAFPVLLFAVIATVLYFVLFARPHPRVPAERMSLAAALAAPAPGAAHGAAQAHGANRDALAAEDEGPGKVAGATEGSSEPGTTEGTEASE